MCTYIFKGAYCQDEEEKYVVKIYFVYNLFLTLRQYGLRKFAIFWTFAEIAETLPDWMQTSEDGNQLQINADPSEIIIFLRMEVLIQFIAPY